MAGAGGLGQYLHDSPKVPACFAKKLYAYGVGANSEDVGKGEIQPFVDGFAAAGYRLPALLTAIVTSLQFFKAAPPAPAKVSMNDH